MFECSTCNCKGVQLYRRFGEWPPRSFLSLGPEWQAKFWAEAAQKTSAAELEEHLINIICRQRTEREETSAGGKYLPLSVWKNKGFDADCIEANCTDFEDHKILGRCYRVVIKGVWSTTIEEAVRKEILNSKRPNLGKKRSVSKSPAANAPLPQLEDSKEEEAKDSRKPLARGRSPTASPPKKKRRHSPSATRSPSQRRSRGSKAERDRSRSSGSSGGGKRKSKNAGRRSPSSRPRSRDRRGDNSNKRGRSYSRGNRRRGHSRSHSREKRRREEKERKERCRAEAEAERAEAKERKQNQQKAVRVLSKIHTILPGLERDTKDKAMKHVPEYGADPAKKSVQALKALKDQCDAVVASRGDKALEEGIDEVEQVCKAAVQNASLLSNLLRTAHQHGAKQ